MAEITEAESERLNEIDEMPLWRISNDILKDSYEFVMTISDRDLVGCRCKVCALADALADEIVKRRGELK